MQGEGKKSKNKPDLDFSGRLMRERSVRGDGIEFTGEETKVKRQSGPGLVLLLALCILAGCGGASTDSPTMVERDEVIFVKQDDEEMNAAMKKARDSLDEFERRFKNPQPTDSDFQVKVRLEAEDGPEHVWAEVVRIEGDVFVATIKNYPRYVKNVKFGDEITVTRDKLSDWSYHDKGKKIGGFTVRVLLKRMPQDQAEALKKEIGWD